MRTLHVNGEVLVERCQALMDGHVKYKLGAKAKPLTTNPSSIRSIDCSGFVQYVLYHACFAHLRAGSWYQNQWFNEMSFSSEDYSRAGPLEDNHLRIAYFPKKRGMIAGHIWLLLNGWTLESYGGLGPGRRRWDVPRLAKNVQRCYRIGDCRKSYHDELAMQCKLVPMQEIVTW